MRNAPPGTRTISSVIAAQPLCVRRSGVQPPELRPGAANFAVGRCMVLIREDLNDWSVNPPFGATPTSGLAIRGGLIDLRATTGNEDGGRLSSVMADGNAGARNRMASTPSFYSASGVLAMSPGSTFGHS